GRYHSDWLSMMYPRLKLARNLLTDDGVIFISIDDNEVANLKKLCDEIFGEDNFIAEFVWQKNFAPKNDNKYISISHEYILCFAKNKDLFNRNLLPREDKHNAGYSNPDNDKRGAWTSGSILATTFSESGVFEIIAPNGNIHLPPNGRCWRYSLSKINELLSENKLWFGKDGNGVPRVKRFLSEMPDGIVPQSWLKYEDVGSGQDATLLTKNIFNNAQVFDFPKPISLLNRFLHIGLNKNDMVLDFFSGSATTAHAVMKLNSDDGGNRKFIMVQLPEPTDEKSEAYKAGYKNICEIGKERIRRAGEQIIGGEASASQLDIGFKVLKLDSSNIKEWDSDYENLEQNLMDSVNNIKSDRSAEDLVYEILLKYGLDLTLPIEELEIEGKRIFDIGHGRLVCCLDSDINLILIEQIVKLKNEYESDYGLEKMRVLFRDSSFSDSVAKTNALQILKQNGIDEVVSV
ncbi:MAG: site-specific DNA-methyltransferase, partial [Arcobacteraceae bacterium]|nr:site-specific DNA-methyltransferase [Arcobacteraceae bacterium]